MRTILKIIDYTNDGAGKAASWLAAILVALISLEVIMRYLFNSPTMWNCETSMMVGGTIFVIGWAYAHRYRTHIRVDIIYTHLPPRGKIIIDVIGFLLLFTPLMIMFIDTSVTTPPYLVYGDGTIILGHPLEPGFTQPS